VAAISDGLLAVGGHRVEFITLADVAAEFLDDAVRERAVQRVWR
jgi:hypothetical protein